MAAGITVWTAPKTKKRSCVDVCYQRVATALMDSEDGQPSKKRALSCADNFFEILFAMCTFQSCGWDSGKVKLRELLEVLKTQNNAGGCSQGRTRTGTVTDKSYRDRAGH